MQHSKPLAWTSEGFSCLGAILGFAMIVFAFSPALAGQAIPAPPPAPPFGSTDYIIGAGDTLQIFVWHNPDLSASVPVRPDGKISIPLVEDIVCAGKTPTELARYIETRLTKFITNPIVTVVVT